MRFSSRIKISIFFGLSGTCLVGSTFKDTTTIIQEWVQTEQLIGEESSEWNIEKAALLDVRGALENEISELTKRLEESEEEAVGAAQQRTELLEQKAEIEETTLSLLDGIDTLETQVEEAFALLPTPLAKRLQPFRNKLKSGIKQGNLPLRQRVDTLLSLLQAISLFHRNITLERQEFSLEDGISREFQVMYFGLGIAYFVNESGTVAGFGSPSQKGWTWKRDDSLAREIATGVDMLNNQAMPRFLKLPFPEPKEPAQ